MVSGQISTIQAFPPTPSPARYHPLVLPQPPSPFAVFFYTLVATLQIAAAATTAPPYPDGFLGLCLVPWMDSRVRLRGKPPHWIAVSSICTGFGRGSPDLPPDRRTSLSDFVDSNRLSGWLFWMSDWPVPDPALGSTFRSIPMDFGEEQPLTQQSQSEPMSSFFQAGFLSRTLDQAILSEPSRLPELSRVEPSQSSDPSWDTQLSPQLLLGWRLGWYEVLCNRFWAQLEPLTYA